ncbi:MAG: DUF3575 domain-containing protein [Bacteroidetes bacterium]|nr:DUF3575 domain-containing protein [Bacteroidota bacterium]
MLAVNVLYSQRDSVAVVTQPVTHNYLADYDQQFSVALRGKLFGFFIIEDTYFSTATLGVEFTMKGKHSLGIDASFFGWQYEHDDKDDNALYETYERRTYAHIDYKYRLWRFRPLDLYFNLYDKLGTYHMWHEGVAEGYNFWEKPFLAAKTDGKFTQVGAGIGIKAYISDRLYFDASVNGGRQFSENTLTTHDDSLNVMIKQYHVRNSNNIFYIRVNLAFKIFVKESPIEYID